MATLEELFKEYSFNKMNGYGFVPIPLPTGSGKSTAIFNFIYQTIKEGVHEDKILLLTSLKKNLQIDELKSVFVENGDEDLYNQKVLFLKSNIDCLLENLPSLMEENKIPESITSLPLFMKVWDAVKYCAKNEAKTDYDTQKVIEEKKEKIRESLEPSFRKYIKRRLTKEISDKLGKKTTYKIRLDYINNAKNGWFWLPQLYPQVLTNEQQIYVMSMDKFLLRNDPIIDGSYFIYKRLSKNAIIFIDEFDATKETVLKRLIDNALDNKIDYICAYRLIKSRLDEGDFPEEMTLPSKRQQESENGIVRLEKVIHGFEERANQIFERHKMNYEFKNAQDFSDEATFLFQDVHSLLVTRKTDKRKLVYKTNSKKRENQIILTSDKDEADRNLTYMVKDVRGFLRFFCGGVWILATNYFERMKEANRKYTMDNAVNSILDNFFPASENQVGKNPYKDFFRDAVLLYYSTAEENRINALDASFFENGFTFYSIEDADDHSLRSSIIMTELESTPEKILLDISKKARVFGVSATADYNTLLGNYALKNYLIPKLKKHYFELDKNEMGVLRERFDNSIKHYDRIEINAIPVENTEVYTPALWNTYFDSDDAEEIASIIQQSVSQEDDGGKYIEIRYLRITQVFKNFIENDKIYSLLCLLTTFPEDKETLNIKILEEIFDDLGKEKYTFKDNVVILRSGPDYEVKKEALKERLSRGEKIFVISTYATVGAGQNLQYKIPENQKSEVIHINDFTATEEKDFDAIYLDKPTNLLLEPKPFMQPEMLLEIITQIEYLKEAGEISFREANHYIEDAFKAAYYGKRVGGIKLSDKSSYTTYATKTIVQAIGRICRTNMKSSKLFIYYDSSIGSILNKKRCNSALINPEFKALLVKAEDNGQVDSEIQNMEQKATTYSEYALSKIISYVENGRNGWKNQAKEEWQSIRTFVLKHPTLTEEDYNSVDDSIFEIVKPLYVEMPEVNNRLWYERVGDYSELAVHFNCSEDYECVSEDDARLYYFLKIPEVEALFNSEGFAKSFSMGKYILCPPAFTNIYKGAIGEVAGKAILEERGLKLEEINNLDFFELFDYKVSGEDIYVDFKHWNEYSAFLPRNKDLKDHIFEKLNRCNAKKGLVINIFAENDYLISNETRDGIELTVIPQLVEIKGAKVNLSEKNINKIIDSIRGE